MRLIQGVFTWVMQWQGIWPQLFPPPIAPCLGLGVVSHVGVAMTSMTKLMLGGGKPICSGLIRVLRTAYSVEHGMYRTRPHKCLVYK